MLVLSSQVSLTAAESAGTIYLLPAQGADARLFDSLNINSEYDRIILELPTPDPEDDMSSFAAGFIARMDTSRPFILIGASLGGMLCAELNEILEPETVIIISSAKNSNELPFRYRFQRRIPLYRIVPGRILHLGAKILQPLVEPDRNVQKETFKSMLYSKDPVYLKRTIGLIVEWNREKNTSNLVHIHGEKDRTIPVRNIVDVDYVVPKGSHMITLTRPGEISVLINKALGTE